MIDPASMPIDSILELFLSGDAAQRASFIEALPTNRSTEQALLAARMNNPLMGPQALDFAATGCLYDGSPSLAEKLAAACFGLARQRFDEGGADASIYRQIAGRAIVNWMGALQRQGRHRDVVAESEEPLAWLTNLDDRDNLESLQFKRVEAFLDIERYDDAKDELEAVRKERLTGALIINFSALRERVERHRGGGTELASEACDESMESLSRIITGASASGGGRQMRASDYEHLREVSEAILKTTLGATVNEFTVRQTVINANRLFLDERRGHNPQEIEKIVPVLTAARDWLRMHNFPDSENDACWSLYLCFTRTDRQAEALKELRRIHTNIERARSSIGDPTERARLSERYPYLYPSMCRLCYVTGQREGLLEAIEASKSRALADLQTQRSGVPATDSEFVGALQELPEHLTRLGAHYLTTFVDEDGVYCALLAPDGTLHTDFVEMPLESLIELLSYRDPRHWGRRPRHDPTLPRIPEDVPERLGVLLRWMEPLAEDGTLLAGQHLCYAPHDALLSIPLHYVEFMGAPLVLRHSLSRAQGAQSLVQILRGKPTAHREYLALLVPSIQESKDPRHREKLAALTEPTQWLKSNMPRGKLLAHGRADIPALAECDTVQRLIHIAAHGTFPEQDIAQRDPNPYRSAGIVLSANGALPDLGDVLRGAGDEHLLSPQMAVNLKLDFTGSHITLQTCVSGLAKRGQGGDALGPEWAFIQLGATSLLSTHWEASATSMSAFVVGFYDRWLKQKESRASAWRNTVLAMRARDECADPYHWAAFSLSGDWR